MGYVNLQEVFFWGRHHHDESLFSTIIHFPSWQTAYLQDASMTGAMKVKGCTLVRAVSSAKTNSEFAPEKWMVKGDHPASFLGIWPSGALAVSFREGM